MATRLDAATEARAHPAALAWRTRFPRASPPYRVETLQEHAGRVVYRLEGVGADGASVIAKRARGDGAAIERYAYESVLSSLPVTLPRFYGGVQAPDGSSWIFLEDVGDERCSATEPSERTHTAMWLAWMHVSAATLWAAARLPDVGPARSLRQLRVMRETLRRAPASGAARKHDAASELLLAELDLAEARWSRLEACAAGLPVTLVHGDFRPEHIRLRRCGAALRIFPFDWHGAGWGVPAVDLVHVDLETYTSVVRERWPGVCLGVVRQVALAGRIFRAIAQLYRETVGIPCAPPAALRKLAAELRDALTAAGVLD